MNRSWAKACLAAALSVWLFLGPSCAPSHRATLRTAGALPAGFRQVPIGVGEDYPRAARNVATVREDLEVLRTTGLEVLRISFPWDAIEPEPGQYDWGFWDSLVSLATDQYHLRLVPYVCYTPRWASSSQGEDSWRQPPKDNAVFAGFMRRIATRYRDRIGSWEIWNEPDNPAYWLGSAEQYAALLQAGSRAVREADPQANVVMGGLAWNLHFLEALLTNAPALSNVDIVNLHNYYETWAEESLEQIPDYVGRASDLLRSHGQFQPLWAAEVGYSSFRKGAYVSGQFRAYYNYEHTPGHEAASLFRALSLLLASGKVSLITWYRLHDLSATQEVIGDVNNRHLGLLTPSGQPKPALAALAYFHSLFGHGFRCLDQEARLSQRIAAPAVAHVFERPDGSVVITAWLRTVVPGHRGDDEQGEIKDKREERIDLLLPFEAGGKARLFDELGRSAGVMGVRRQHGETRLEGLTLRDGGVVVVMLNEAKR